MLTVKVCPELNPDLLINNPAGGRGGWILYGGKLYASTKALKIFKVLVTV